jgi:hypothetical protein
MPAGQDMQQGRGMENTDNIQWCDVPHSRTFLKKADSAFLPHCFEHQNVLLSCLA